MDGRLAREKKSVGRLVRSAGQSVNRSIGGGVRVCDGGWGTSGDERLERQFPFRKAVNELGGGWLACPIGDAGCRRRWLVWCY